MAAKERPLQPSGQLVLTTSLWLALRAASAANIGNPADVSPLRRGSESWPRKFFTGSETFHPAPGRFPRKEFVAWF
jgi:hypothetical protein